jgi:hypothetical protein
MKHSAMSPTDRAAAQHEVDAAFAAAAAAGLARDGAPHSAFATQTDPVALQLHAALKRVEELEPENTSLRTAVEAARAQAVDAELKAFFASVNTRTLLTEALCQFNCWDAEEGTGQTDGPHCGCLACGVAGRIDFDANYPSPPRCMFKPAFEAILQELDISYNFSMGLHDESAAGSLYVQVLGADALQDCSPEDAHLVAKSDWVFAQFGRRVWAATSVEDEAVRKMQRLLKRLYQDNAAAARVAAGP